MTQPVLYWFRRDLRLSDNPALSAAAESGAPVIPVFVLDPLTEALGAAHRWRLGEGLKALDAALRDRGSRLTVLRGPALEVLRGLAKETGAAAVHWSRLYDPDCVARDKAVKAALKEDGMTAVSHAGHLLHEPWTIETGSGGFYKVYTPFWKAVRDRAVDEPLSAPPLVAPSDWPESLSVDDLKLGADMRRGAAVVAKHARVGEGAARGRLGAFIANGIADYDARRDRLDLDGTSKLSENLALGEISVRTCWHAARAALEDGKPGAETYLKELVWRDFAYHLIWHTPHIATGNWREDWDGFPWRGDNADAEKWKRGRTGEPVIDAAMRELYATGTMHNRARMLVASYLTKHLMTDWRVGLGWFADCLIDWDPASNAMGWQWAAGSGPDAAPFFRIFNPATQAEKFDPEGDYRDRFLKPGAEGAQDFLAAIPRSWTIDPGDPYPPALVDLKVGRQKALDAYQAHKG